VDFERAHESDEMVGFALEREGEVLAIASAFEVQTNGSLEASPSATR
jgi:hypothetical protein